MSSSDKRSYPSVYTPLDRGDNELIGVKVTSCTQEDTSKGVSSSEPSLNIVTLFDSRPSSNDSTSRATNSFDSGRQEVTSCCVCQAAWGHWRTELGKREKKQSSGLTTGDMERSSAARVNSDSVCRICLEERGTEGFISPCDCSGTMGMVHRSCLERWLTLLNSSECEICRHKFKVRRYMRPANQFQLTQLPLEVCGDLICITVLSPLCILIIYFTVDASVTSVKTGKTSGAIALMVVATTIILVYFIWVYCTIKHALEFWWGSNRIVRLSTNQVAPAQGNMRT